MALKLWKPHGLIEILANDNGFYFFRFESKDGMEKVLLGGPRLFVGRAVFLRRWRPNMILSKEGCKLVPIWVHFRNIPLEYWTDEGLSHIASVVGRPLHVDKWTGEIKRLNYARICIEVDAEGEFPKSMELEMDDGSITEISMEYSWLPKRCGVCKEFGHVTKDCKKGLNVERKPKPNATSHLDETWKKVKRHRKEVVVGPNLPNIGDDGSDKPRSDSALASSSHNLDGQSCSEHVELSAANTTVAPEEDKHRGESTWENSKEIVIASSHSFSIVPSSGNQITIGKEVKDRKNSFSPLADLVQEGIDGNPVITEDEIATPIRVDTGGNSVMDAKTTPSDASATPCLNRLAEKVKNIDEVEKRLGMLNQGDEAERRRHKNQLHKDTRKKKRGSGSPSSSLSTSH